ncbi:DMT family transporter [Nocardia abscessus]|uniref:DMT family transporter n=1 Tax=Nocardia abscessus TaxID=120957 RepID=UPI002B4B6326|nr:DMT family transporter [Nocardia abscessus]
MAVPEKAARAPSRARATGLSPTSGRLTAPVALGGLQAPVWLALLVLAVVGTVLPYLAGLRALRVLPSTLAGVLALVEPLVAAVLAWLLLGEVLTLTQQAGAVILLIGAVLAQLARPETASGRPPEPRHEKRVVPDSTTPTDNCNAVGRSPDRRRSTP